MDSKIFKSILVKNPKPMKLSNFNEKLTPFADIAPIATAPVAAIVVVIIAIQPNDAMALPVLQQAQAIFVDNNLFFGIFALHRTIIISSSKDVSFIYYTYFLLYSIRTI
ncbi:hypothetical protein HYX14_05215 [Candidatus Woesearchaeota archaeon]|nr:hypothetical protein [Candidatus Woesearchaeota archaeon]